MVLMCIALITSARAALSGHAGWAKQERSGPPRPF
jgi:hypothetical protein